MNRYAIVVAGGKGLRMGGDVPKQFIPVGGRPILMRTLDVFLHYDSQISLVLVLPPSQQPLWRQLCEAYRFEISYQVADGGLTRFQSVRNGLALIPDEGESLVAVHDGVRPFVSPDVIERCYEAAALHGAALPVTDIVDTVRRLSSEPDMVKGSVTVPRQDYKLVQTPQVFRTALLKEAYRQTYRSDFTDDASVVEALGHPVCLVAGNRENIKITTPFDLKMAEALLR